MRNFAGAGMCGKTVAVPTAAKVSLLGISSYTTIQAEG
jgi:hypothetical protein